jgi:hypothetical protein
MSDKAGSDSSGGNAIYRLASSHVPEVTSNGRSVPGVVGENGAAEIGVPVSARPNVSANCCRRVPRLRQRHFVR